jgi:tetratricopeptide (TPR) repeat protein
MRLGDEQIQALLNLAQSQLELEQVRQAGKSFETLLKYMPAHPDALYGLAEIARRQHKAKRQRALLEELVSVHPQHLAGVLMLSRLLTPALALPFLERALEAHPHQPDLLLLTTEYLQRTGSGERAGFYLEQLVKSPSEPLSAEAWLQLAQLQLRAGELQAAATGFDRAVALNPALREDSRWVDIEGQWQKFADRQAGSQADVDWQALEARLGSGQ